MLGAAPMWACDVDPEALQVARGNAGPNLFIGSADAVRADAAGLIVANISPEAIARLAPELLRCIAPGGILLVSGFERHEAAALQTGLEKLGGAFCEARYKETWALLAVRGKLDGGI